jgi:hypothetical protein
MVHRKSWTIIGDAYSYARARSWRLGRDWWMQRTMPDKWNILTGFRFVYFFFQYLLGGVPYAEEVAWKLLEIEIQIVKNFLDFVEAFGSLVEPMRNFSEAMQKLQEENWKSAGSSVEGRVPLLECGWFQKSQRLAIADIVYVNGIGLCSHQPEIGVPFTGHRLQDLDGNIHIIVDDRLLFLASREEMDEYWRQSREREANE